jgi:hypothetical protein
MRTIIKQVLSEHGWTPIEEPPYTGIGSKKFTTAVGKKTAMVSLGNGDGYNRTLAGFYQSEGRNALESQAILLPIGASDKDVRLLAIKFVTQNEAAIRQTYAMKLLLNADPPQLPVFESSASMAERAITAVIAGMGAAAPRPGSVEAQEIKQGLESLIEQFRVDHPKYFDEHVTRMLRHHLSEDLDMAFNGRESDAVLLIESLRLCGDAVMDSFGEDMRKQFLDAMCSEALTEDIFAAADDSGAKDDPQSLFFVAHLALLERGHSPYTQLLENATPSVGSSPAAG